MTERRSWSWCEGPLTTTAASAILLLLVGSVMIGCEPDLASEDASRLVSPAPASTSIPSPAPTPSASAPGPVAEPDGRTPVPSPTLSPAPTPTTSPSPTPTASPTPTPSIQEPAIVIGDTAFRAELATTTADQVKGLSGRDSLPPQNGMLFIFETGVTPAFWMRGMRFPLDFIWISKDCIVADITPNVPVPEEGATALPVYVSATTTAYNFEVNAGEADIYGIASGTPVRFVGFSAESGAVCE